MGRCRWLLIILCCLKVPLAAAEAPGGAPWVLDSSIKISPSEMSALRERFPYIRDANDLSLILASTSFKSPSSMLRVEWVDDKWVIKARSAPVVSAINFSLAPFTLLPSLRNSTSQWIGLVHTPELQTKIESDINRFLFKSGYRNAKTTVKIDEEKDGNVEYSAILNIGAPCIIQGYLWPEKLPSNINLPTLENGEPCDETAAAASVDEIERKLQERGFVQAGLDFGGFVTDNNGEDAYVRVMGSFGEKISYEFVDPSSGINLINQLTTTEIQAVNPKVAGPDAVAYELSHLLKNRGYLDVSVTGPEIRRESANSARYVFNVYRGDVYHMNSVQYEGNDHFSTSDLSSMMKLENAQVKTSGQEETQLPPYSPEGITTGLEAVKAAYVKDGFWDVKVTERIAQRSAADRHQVQIIISVDEGKQRLFSKIEPLGAKRISSEDIAEFWTIRENDPFDQSALISFQQKIRTEYANLGYFYTTVTLELEPHSGENQNVQHVTVKVNIDEGPRVRFGDIFVAGLVRTKQKVVLRDVLFETGDWYDPELIAASRRALLRLGIFSSVTIKPLDPVALSNRSEMMDILIEVKESPSRTIAFGPGWSSFYGMRYNVEGSLTNIFGTGRQIYSSASFDQEKSQNALGPETPRTLVGRSLAAGYLEPHILDSSINGTVSASQVARATDYAWSLTRQGELEFSHTLRSVIPGSKIAGFYGRKLSEEESDNVIRDAFLADTFRIGRLGTRFVIDQRDDLTWPTKGYTINSELAWARYELGGDVRYFRWEIGNNHYFSILDNLVFAVGFNFSAFQGVTRQNESSKDILPASERLAAGGSDSVRGFRERSLGPLVRRPNIADGSRSSDCGYTTTASGGTRRTLLKSELRYRWTESIATTAFVDSGNTSFSAEEKAKFDKAFAEPLDIPGSDTCADPARLSIEDNIGYELSDLIANPQYIWERHYTSAGAALNLLTPIGSINLAYGVPWHEPKLPKCKENSDYCYSRTPDTKQWWKKGELHLNVGAKF